MEFDSLEVVKTQRGQLLSKQRCPSVPVQLGGGGQTRGKTRARIGLKRGRVSKKKNMGVTIDLVRNPRRFSSVREG